MKTSLIPFGTRFGLYNAFEREMDNLMTRFIDADNGHEMSQWYAPQANVSETDEEYEVTLDLPGMQPEEFNVELKHGDLWITGERKEETEKKGRRWHRVECRYGQFRRVIRLSDDVDPENVDAEYKDGVLRISVRKAETACTKHIDVKS